MESDRRLPARRGGTANTSEHVWNAAACIAHASLTHRQAPYALPPGEWSLPEGAPVVGAGTERYVSHPWPWYGSTCDRTRVTRHEGSRCRVETELPTCREATYIRRARGESPLRAPPRLILLPFSPILPLPSLSYRTPSRARARPNRRGCSDQRAVHPYYIAAHTVHPSSTCRDAASRGMRPPRHGAPLTTRTDAPLAGRLVGWLAGWLLDSLAECAWQALLWVTLTHLDLLRASWLRRDQSAWC